ncbi:uncharacterized protein [Periplaneta americana]
MGNHVKKKRSSSSDENELEQPMVPLHQMISEEDDEFLGETYTRLTRKVRTCYFNHLKKILISNYEICQESACDWACSQDDVIKCAVWMEQKALRSSMVVLLYQRAMTRMAADIKKHTEQLKLYTKLKDYVTSDFGSSNKTTQTSECINYVDKTTQTETVNNVSEIPLPEESFNLRNQTRTENLSSSIEVQCFQPVTIKKEIDSSDIQGVPIPVYVSGMSSVIRSQNNQYLPSINGIEPLFCEVSHECVPNININNLHQCPVSCDIPDVTSQSGGVTETLSPQQNLQEEEPFEWSIIDEQTKLNTQNAVSKRKGVFVRKLSDMQKNKNLSNGTACEDNSSDVDSEEYPRMSIDERISAVLNSNPVPVEEQSQFAEAICEVPKEYSVWTIEKQLQQELLHEKILQTCVDVRKRGRMRLRFLELFGSDSEDSFSVDEPVSLYKDKIARWVVESLMPYYREGRILSRSLFKFLARHIADKLLVRKHKPDEADVDHSVMEFFSHHDVIKSEADVHIY